MRKIENFNSNNFDVLRLIAALLVLITHGYELNGDLTHDFLYRVTACKLRFSTVGLYLFFFTSGYLVTNSFLRTNSTGQFIWKRFLRIYPGLIIVILITTFIVGPLFTEYNIKNYFSATETYAYILTCSGIYIRHTLPGLFKNINHFDHGVNGSLWSIGLEIKLYILLILSGIIYKKGRKNIFYFLLMLVLLFTLLVNSNIYHLQNYFDALHTRLFFIFWIGSLACLNFKKIRLNIFILLAVFAGWIITMYYLKALALIFEPMFFAYLAIYFCYTPRTISLKMDISYGIYIYAFLISQILIELYRGLSSVQLIFLTLIIVIPLSICSWIFIEKKALARKKNYSFLFRDKMHQKNNKA